MGISDVLNKKLLIVASAAVLFLGLAGSVQEVDAGLPPGPENVFSIDSFDPILRIINPDTGATISSVGITLTGERVNGGRGLAFNPADGKLYAFLKIDGSGDTFLVTLDPATGVATLIGDTGDRFNAMAFKGNTLFAASARNASVKDTLFTMSTVDASSIALCELPSNRGQGLALNPVDGFLYHYTFDDFNRIDDTTVDPCGLTNIPTSSGGEFNTALTFRTLTGVFLFGEDDTSLFTLSASGQGPNLLSIIDAQPRGFAIITGVIPPPPGLPPGEHVFSIDAGGLKASPVPPLTKRSAEKDASSTILTVEIVAPVSGFIL